jgi:O-antigen/teichoic acid export membrane protein
MSVAPPEPGGSSRNWEALFHFFLLSFGYTALRCVLNPVQIKVLTSLLSPEEYGTLTLITIAAWELAHVSSAGHYEFILQRLPGRPEGYQLGALALVWRYFGSFVALLAAIIATALLILRPAQIAFDPTWVVIAGIASVVLVFLFQRIYFLLARAEWMRVRVLQLIWSDSWFIPILIAAAFTSVSLDIALAGWLVWLLLASVLAYRWVGTGTHAARAYDLRIGEVVRFGAPLMPMMLGLSLIGFGERYLLALLQNVEAVAKYTLSFNIAFIVYVIGAAVLDLFVPEFNKACNRLSSGDALEATGSDAPRVLFTTMLRYLLLLALTGGLFLLLCGRQLVAIISQREYGGAAQIIPFLALVPLFYLLWTLFNRILLARGDTRVIGMATLAVTAIDVGLNVLLIPRLGEIGCALALTTSLSLLALFTGAYARGWRWMIWSRLKAGRLFAMAAINGIGIFLSQAMLGDHALICVVVASLWCAACILTLRLVHWDDWSALKFAPPQEASHTLGSTST